jgi:hypothetical protein
VNARQLAERLERHCHDTCRQSLVIYLSLLNAAVRFPLTAQAAADAPP